MKKPLPIIAAAAALALAACSPTGTIDSSSGGTEADTSSTSEADSSESGTSSSSSSSSLAKIEPTVDLAKEKLAALKDTNIIHYRTEARRYQDSYIDGTVYANSLETIEMHSYDGAFEGSGTLQQLNGIIETTVDSSESGRLAGYYIDEESFAYGYNGNETHDGDYLYIQEVNPYQNLTATEESMYSSLIDAVVRYFDDPDSAYSSEDGFEVSDIGITEEEDGFLFSFDAKAEESGYYGREEHTCYVLLDLYTGDVLELGTTMLLYDMGYTDEDPNVSANNITTSKLTILETGQREKKDIEPIDEESVPADSIYNSVSKKVEGLEEGTLSEDSVRAILANIGAYNEGIVLDEFTVETSDLTDIATYGSLGQASGSGKATYADGIYEEETVYTLADESTVTQKVRHEQLADGVKVIASQNDDEIVNSTTPGAYVTSMDSYFAPGPFGATTSTACSSYVISSIASDGFGTNSEGAVSTLVEATNIDGKITISIERSAETSFGDLYSSTDKASITIEITDGVLSKVIGRSDVSATMNGQETNTVTSETHVLSTTLA